MGSLTVADRDDVVAFVGEEFGQRFTQDGLVSLLLPLLAIPTDFLIIGSMGLHGC